MSFCGMLAEKIQASREAGLGMPSSGAHESGERFHVSQVGSEESAGEEAKSSPDVGTTVAAAVPELQTGGPYVRLSTHCIS